MGMQTAQRLSGGFYRDPQPVGGYDRPGVAGLPPGLAVKRSLVRENRDLIAGLRVGSLRAVFNDGYHPTFAHVRTVSDEFGRTFAFCDVEPDRVVRRRTRSFPGSTSGILLTLHGLVEPGAINAQSTGAEGVFGKIVGEAVGIVELECGLTIQRAAVGQVGYGLV